MKTITASLEEHQRSGRRRPHVLAHVEQWRFRAPVLPFEEHHADADSPAPTAAALTAAGTLLLARNSGGSVQVKRVTDAEDPTAATYGASWTTVATATAGAGLAVADGPAGLRLLYADGADIETRTSINDGLNWSAPATAATAPAAIDDLAFAFDGSADGCAFIVADDVLYRLRLTAGSWAGSPTAWPHGSDVSSLNGVGAAYDTAYRLGVTGVDDDGNPAAFAVSLLDSFPVVDVFSAPQPVAVSDPDADTSYSSPAVLRLVGHTRIFFSVHRTGDVETDRVHWTHHVPGDNHLSSLWSEPAPFHSTSPGGVAIADTFAADSAHIWHAEYDDGVLADLTDHLTHLVTDLAQNRQRLTAAFAVDDVDAVDNWTGFTLRILTGYASGADNAPEFGTDNRYAIERQSISVDDRGRRTLTIHASGPWEQLARWRAPAAWQVAAGTASRGLLFQQVAARAGIDIASANGGSAWTTFEPAFSVAPGESGAVAAARLLAVAAEEAIDDGGLLTVLEPDGATADDYGPLAHPITALALEHSTPAANWTRITGPDRVADAVDVPSIDRVGPTAALLRNLDADTDAKAEAYAAHALARRLRDRPAGTLEAPLHAGLQLFDAITVTDSALGASSRPYRVTAIRSTYDRRPGRPAAYSQRLQLTPV